jgi:hypothetical protein
MLWMLGSAKIFSIEFLNIFWAFLTLHKVRKWVKLSIMSNAKVFSMLFLNI